MKPDLKIHMSMNTMIAGVKERYTYDHVMAKVEGHHIHDDPIVYDKTFRVRMLAENVIRTVGSFGD